MGDFEDVDEFIRNQLIKPGKFSDDPCQVDNFDAIASLRNEVFIFIGEVCVMQIVQMTSLGWSKYCM